MSNIRRKPTPTTAKPKANNTTNNGSGNIIEPKDLNDGCDKVIYHFSTLTDKEFNIFWKLDIINKIRSHYEVERDNVILQRAKINETNEAVRLLNNIKEQLLQQKLPMKSVYKIDEEIFYDLFSGLVNDFHKFKKEDNKILVPLKAVTTQIEVYEILLKLYKLQKKKSTICINLGNAIIKKNTQSSSLLLNDLKNVLDELIELDEYILTKGSYTRVEEHNDGGAEESNNEEAYLDTCTDSKHRFNFHKVAVTILINEYYRFNK